MSGITLEKAQAILDALLEAQLNLASGGDLRSVSIAGRTVTFRDLDELDERIIHWQNIVARLQRCSVGAPRHGRSIASFRSCR